MSVEVGGARFWLVFMWSAARPGDSHVSEAQ